MKEFKNNIFNVIDTYYAPIKKGGENKILEIVDDLTEGCGYCDKCFGRGYILDNFEFCNCERGKSLENFVSNIIP